MIVPTRPVNEAATPATSLSVLFFGTGYAGSLDDAETDEPEHGAQRLGERRARTMVEDGTTLMARPFHLKLGLCEIENGMNAITENAR